MYIRLEAVSRVLVWGRTLRPMSEVSYPRWKKKDQGPGVQGQKTDQVPRGISPGGLLYPVTADMNSGTRIL